MKKSFLTVSCVILSLFFSLFFTGAARASEAEPIKVGVLAPFTGFAAAFGLPVLYTTQMWADEVNAAGGLEVAGVRHKIELFKEDSKFEPSAAASGAERLVHVDNVLFIHGPCSPFEFMAISPVTTKAKVVTFSYGWVPELASSKYPDNFNAMPSPRELAKPMFAYLKQSTPQPPEMKPEAYERTLRARAFDGSRYLLPLATNTSLGEIVNARTLESQISQLLSHTHKEVRHLGELLKRAAASPAYHVSRKPLGELVNAIRAVSPELGARADEQLLREIRVAPTLVKYADPNPYEIETRRELRECARQLMGNAPVDPAPLVDLLEEEPLEIELAATLMYEHSHYSYRQVRTVIEEKGEPVRREIIDLGLRHRGRHDEMLRAFCAGQSLRFDILMDVGGFRDMHRHRRCIQILQDFTTEHGYDTPDEVNAAGQSENYHAVMRRAASAVEALSRAQGSEARENAQYAIPLAYRKRSLFKMDFAEVVYISELRTAPAGNQSYRNVAYAMFEAVGKKYPALKKFFRVHDVREPVDLLKR